MKEGFLFQRQEGLQSVCCWEGAIREGEVGEKERGRNERRIPKEGKEIKSPNVVAQFGGGGWRWGTSGPALDSGGSKQLPTLPSSQYESLGGNSPNWQRGAGSWARGCSGSPGVPLSPEPHALRTRARKSCLSLSWGVGGKQSSRKPGLYLGLFSTPLRTCFPFCKEWVRPDEGLF